MAPKWRIPEVAQKDKCFLLLPHIFVKDPLLIAGGSRRRELSSGEAKAGSLPPHRFSKGSQVRNGASM